MKFAKSAGSGFHDCCSGTDCYSVIGWQEYCVVYSFFCILIIIVIIIISSISIYIVVFLNCLYLRFTFCPFLLPILLG